MGVMNSEGKFGKFFGLGGEDVRIPNVGGGSRGWQSRDGRMLPRKSLSPFKIPCLLCNPVFVTVTVTRDL